MIVAPWVCYLNQLLYQYPLPMNIQGWGGAAGRTPRKVLHVKVPHLWVGHHLTRCRI